MPLSCCGEITFLDLPTLQDELGSCDRGLLAKVVMADQVRAGFPLIVAGKEQCAAAERRIANALEAVCSLDVECGPEGRFVLYPEESFSLDGRTGMIKRRLVAALFDMDRIELIEAMSKALGSRVHSYEQVESIYRDKRKRAAIEIEELEPESYVLNPWEGTLAYRAWLPQALCERERCMVLASAFCEIAFQEIERGCSPTSVFGKGGIRLQGEDALCDGDRSETAGSEESNGEDAWDLPEWEDAFPSGYDSLYGLRATDQFDCAYREKLAQIVAVLNHNARINNCETLLDLACRLEVGQHA